MMQLTQSISQQAKSELTYHFITAYFTPGVDYHEYDKMKSHIGYLPQWILTWVHNKVAQSLLKMFSFYYIKKILNLNGTS